MTFQHILNGYLNAIEFTDCGPDDEERQDAAWSDGLFTTAQAHVTKFLSMTPDDLLHGLDPMQIGHDLWLTRNGHGVGFWDRGLGDRGDTLSEICRAMGEVDTYVGDDDELHLS
jgi:hypothetical protein